MKAMARGWLAGVLAVLAGTGTLLGASASWTGSASTLWNVNANWGGTEFPGTVNTDVATFTGTPTANQPKWNIDGGNIGKIVFETAGWTLSGAFYQELILRYGDKGISSQGAGTNAITATVWQYAAGTWDVGAGNTLVFSGYFEQRTSPTKTGAGKLVFSAIGTGGYQNNGGGFVTSGGTTLCNFTNRSTEGSQTWSVSGGATLGGLGAINIATNALEDQTKGVTVTVSGAGSTLAPGGDGYFGSRIGTLSIYFGSLNTAANLVRLLDGTRLAMDLAAQNGVCDRLALHLVGAAVNGYLKLSETGSQTLALSGPSRMPYGNDYTLVTFPSTAVNYGAFEVVTYNGASVTADPNVVVTYGADHIAVSFLPLPPGGTVITVR